MMSMEERAVVVGLGANLGEARETVMSAFDEIAAIEGVRELRRSRLYRTSPVGGPPQADYVNAAVLVRTKLPAKELLARLQEIELAHGRTRGKERDLPRTLDLDILFIEGEVIREPNLEVPHPRLTERAFALVPLLDVAEEARDPSTGVAYAELLLAVDRSGVAVLD